VSLRRVAAGALAAALVLGACSASNADETGDRARPPDAEPATAVSTDPLVRIAKDPVPALPVTVESADGRSVRVTDVSRIVSLWVNLSEVVYSIGLGDNLVGRDVSTTFDEAEKVPLVTRAHDISAEGVLSLEPTVVLADTESGPPEAIAQLRAAGVPVVVFPRSNKVTEIQPGIERVAAALGLPDEGRMLADHTTAELATVQGGIPAGGKRPRVAFLYLRGRAGVYLLGGPGSGADSMIETAGGIDAGTAMGLDQPFTPITSEALVEAAPDVILTTTSGLESVNGVSGLVKTPGVAQTPAGAARRIVTEEDGLLYGFGARTPDALRELIRELYRDRVARP
jgi:iron complex transport system substrate-binding protein